MQWDDPRRSVPASSEHQDVGQRLRGIDVGQCNYLCLRLWSHCRNSTLPDPDSALSATGVATGETHLFSEDLLSISFQT